MKRVLFISDLHLSEERPETTRAFRAFVAGPARNAGALYILGDLLEYWAGDDDVEAPLAASVCAALAGLAEQGVSIYFMGGNRDFLVGEGFAARARFSLLADPSEIRLGDRRVLLSHGDALCTDDVGYQAYRRQVRDPQWLQGFLARPLAERKAFIDNLRKQSALAKQGKSEGIMDVNREAVEALLRAHRHPLLIHGHTHRPARHLHLVDGRECERWVLADWDDSAPYLEWNGSTLVAHRYRPAPPAQA